MSVRRKSRWRSQNLRHHKKRANQRAAKERKRLAALAAPMDPDVPQAAVPRGRPTGFRVTVECLEDGQRASFTAARGPFGLTISPTLAGRRVTCVLQYYVPERLAR